MYIKKDFCVLCVVTVKICEPRSQNQPKVEIKSPHNKRTCCMFLWKCALKALQCCLLVSTGTLILAVWHLWRLTWRKTCLLDILHDLETEKNCRHNYLLSLCSYTKPQHCFRSGRSKICLQKMSSCVAVTCFYFCRCTEGFKEKNIVTTVCYVLLHKTTSQLQFLWLLHPLVKIHHCLTVAMAQPHPLSGSTSGTNLLISFIIFILDPCQTHL